MTTLDGILKMALTDKAIKALKPGEKTYKVADRDGLYLSVAPSGTMSFRFNYRYNNRQQTVTLGKYGEITLAQAREKLLKAKADLAAGITPAKKKQEIKNTLAENSFSVWLDKYTEECGVADSTKKMRGYAIDNYLRPALGKMSLFEITENEVRALAEDLVKQQAPSTALLCRMIIKNVYTFASMHGGPKLKSPTDFVRPSSIHTFKSRTRAMSPREIGYVLNGIEQSSSDISSKSAFKLILLTLLRKSEVINGVWSEIDWNEKTWRIPAERMKTKRPHNVYLSKQAFDILVCLRTLSTCKSDFIFPAKYGLNKPMATSTPNRLLELGIANAKKAGIEIEPCTIHDLRRTASTLLNEAEFNSDWIEASLAHVASGVRAVYNVADYAPQRRRMLQAWADMVDKWQKEYQLRESELHRARYLVPNSIVKLSFNKIKRGTIKRYHSFFNQPRR